MNPNEQPLQSQTPRPLSEWTGEELDAFYKTLCPGAITELAFVDTKPKKRKKKSDALDTNSSDSGSD